MKYIISSKNLPPKSPIILTLTSAIALDYWNANDIIIGAVICLLIIIWIAFISTKLKTEEVVFKLMEDDEDMVKVSGFKDRMETAIKERQILKDR
jgi:hypothetical protein